MAVDHLIQHGNRRITCIAANSHLLTIKERINGYRESMRRAKLPCAKEVLLSSQSSANSALSDLLSTRNRPEALFTANNAATIWVLDALNEMKIAIGKMWHSWASMMSISTPSSLLRSRLSVSLLQTLETYRRGCSWNESRASSQVPVSGRFSLSL